MPVNESRNPFRITEDIEQVRIWELIEARVTLALECAACHRRATWPPDLVRRRLGRNTAARLITVAGRIRCGACRSCFILISRDRPSNGPALPAGPDPAVRRGFTEANLDANARRGPWK